MANRFQRLKKKNLLSKQCFGNPQIFIDVAPMRVAKDAADRSISR